MDARTQRRRGTLGRKETKKNRAKRSQNPSCRTRTEESIRPHKQNNHAESVCTTDTKQRAFPRESGMSRLRRQAGELSFLLSTELLGI